MPNYYEKAEIFAWMPMIGFDREHEDKGVGNFLNRTQFTPNGTFPFWCLNYVAKMNQLFAARTKYSLRFKSVFGNLNRKIIKNCISFIPRAES